MSRGQLAAAAALTLGAAAWPSDAQAYLNPQVEAEITLADEQFAAGNDFGAHQHLTNAKQLADQHRDWEGMLILAAYYSQPPDKPSVWELEDAYSLALQYAYDLAYRDQHGPNAGANCLEGRLGLEYGILLYDVLFDGIFPTDTAPGSELRYQRDHAQTNLDKMNQTPCPP